jgi:hypothetical protein
MPVFEGLSLAAKYIAGTTTTYVSPLQDGTPPECNAPTDNRDGQWLVVFAYRIFLHPLSKYPGPFIAKLTEGYAGFYAGLQRLHLVTQQNHQKYGMWSY